MDKSISSEELEYLIAGYVLYDLSPEESATLKRMMLANPAITQEIEQMHQVLELAFGPTDVQPAKKLRAVVLDAYQSSVDQIELTQRALFDQHKSSLAQSPKRWAASHSKWQRRGVGLGAAALIMGLGISNYVLWRSLQTLQSRQQTPETIVVSLQPVKDTNDLTKATLTIDSNNLQATLKATDLPPLSEGEVYALWTVLQSDAPFTTDDKDSILTAIVTAEDLTDASANIVLPQVYREQAWIKAIAVTIESADAPQRHEASPILFTPL